MVGRARWVALAMLCACSPNSFDDLVGTQRSSDASVVDVETEAGIDAATGGAGDHAGGSGGGTAGSGDGGRGSDPGSDAGRDAGANMDAGADAGDAGDAGDAALADAGPPSCPRAGDPADVRLAVSELGVLPVPEWVSWRIGERSAAVDGRVLWTFTLADFGNMVAWGDVDDLTATPPRLSEQPPQVPLLPANANPDGRPVTVTSVLGTGDGEALIFFGHFVYLVAIEVGLARIERDQQQAEVVRTLGSLFMRTTTWRPIPNTGAMLERTSAGSFVYVYACDPNPDVPEENVGGLLDRPCRVARVLLDDVADPESYRYWDGVRWTQEGARAVVVMRGVFGGLTVSFNRYLGKFLAVHSGASNNLELRWADRPEGPWHALGTVNTRPGGGPLGISLYGADHPALRDACEQVLYLSYVLDFTDANGVQSAPMETRLVRVELQ